MTKYNIAHILFSFVISFFLFASVSTIQAAPRDSITVSVSRSDSVQHIVKKVNKALARKGYKLKEGDAKHINNVARKAKKVATRGKGKKVKVSVKLRCTTKPLKCEIVVTVGVREPSKGVTQ